MDIAIIFEDGSEQIFSNVTLQAEEWTRNAIPNLEDEPSCILPNANIKGYCRVSLDKQSLQYALDHI